VGGKSGSHMFTVPKLIQYVGLVYW